MPPEVLEPAPPELPLLPGAPPEAPPGELEPDDWLPWEPDEELLCDPEEELLLDPDDDDVEPDDPEAPEEPLEEEGEGMLGGCGVVGLLALGQPASSRQAQQSAPIAAGCRQLLLADDICPDYPLRFHRFPVLEARPEWRLAQRPHEA